MVISDKVIDQIRDFRTIGQSIITFVNGVLCIVLVIISGTSSVNSASDAILLRNLSVGFGSSVAILNLVLALGVDILISLCTNNIQDEQLLREMFKNDPKLHPDEAIIEGTQVMVSVVNQMKIASNNLTPDTVNKPIEFKDQLKNLEEALNQFGTIP